MKKTQLLHSLLLLLTAVIWGVAFVAQSAGMDHVGPYTFNCARSLLGGLVLLPVLAARRHGQTGSLSRRERRTLLAGGVMCGAALFMASSLQQIGIQYTSVGKAGFITACYIVLVPLLGLLLGKRCSLSVAAAVGMALVGLYLLCVTETLSVGLGDLLMLGCALMFSVHILVIDFFAPRADGVALSCIQFFVCALLSAVPALALGSALGATDGEGIADTVGVGVTGRMVGPPGVTVRSPCGEARETIR